MDETSRTVSELLSNPRFPAALKHVMQQANLWQTSTEPIYSEESRRAVKSMLSSSI